MESKTKVGMVQINNSFSRQSYFPYSVGILQAFAQKHLKDPESFEFLPALFSRIPVDTAIEALREADVVCFSAYVWNIRLSLNIAEQLKKSKPAVITVFGGPQVPDRGTEDFLRANPFIDLACHGEGEKVFLSILENCARREWLNVPSVSYISESGEFVQTPACGRISNFDTVPSPYLEGVFESLIAANPETEWIALWETNRGCPFSCAYCDWGSATKNKVYARDIKTLFGEVDWFSRHNIEFIFCCDANFSILDRDIEIVERVALNKRKYGYPKALSVQSTKNFTERSYQIYKVMSNAGLSKGVSLSLQSLNADTLNYIRRKNISADTFKHAQQRLTSFNIETFTDIILGLPGETYDSFADGVSSTIENGQHNRIQFNNLSILPNAEMGDPDYQRRFGFDVVETDIINIHGSLAETDSVREKQQLVVGTATMPKPDWVRSRVFGWMTSLLHFDKLLQIPFVVLHELYSVSFRELIELFTEGDNVPPILSQIRTFFTDKAVDIQNGDVEFCESKDWLNLWWPADELTLIRLCTQDKLAGFYEEAQYLIGGHLRRIGATDSELVLGEAIVLNHNLMKLPFQRDDLQMHLSLNVWDIYHAAVRGRHVPLRKGRYRCTVDRSSVGWHSWQDWCREVVWYGNKRGAYMHGCNSVRSERTSIIGSSAVKAGAKDYVRR